METSPHWRSTARLEALLYGYAAAALMWFIGFVTHLPGMTPAAPLVGLALSMAQMAGGNLLARRIGRSAALRRAWISGLVTSAINLLVVGGVMMTPTEGGGSVLQPGWPMMVLGTLLFGPILATLGAFLAPAGPGRLGTSAPRDVLPRFAAVCAFSALPVLLSGGLVTSVRAGLAVPDWPTTYNAAMFLYPLADMTGGIYYEHAHRLFGSLVGLTVLTFFILALAVDRRPRTLLLAGLCLAAVIGQGVLGGVRVTAATPTSAEALAATTDNRASLFLAFVHGITGQLTFALLALTAALLSARWASASRARSDSSLRLFSAIAMVLLIVQLAIGAGYRHFEHIAFLHSHLTMAVLVIVAAGLAAFRAIGKHADEPLLRRLGHATLHSMILQVLLGLGALALVLINKESDPPLEVAVTTAHQALGAVLLASGVLLFAWTRRLVGPGRPT